MDDFIMWLEGLFSILKHAMIGFLMLLIPALIVAIALELMEALGL